MNALLDTCVLSEFQHKHPNPDVVKKISEIPANNVFVSVVSIGEIIKGIRLLRTGKRKEELSSWVAGLERGYAERLLDIDLETTRIWGEITALAQKYGKIIPATDGLIAATAIRHGLHLMTRDVPHFEPTGVMLVNPWK